MAYDSVGVAPAAVRGAGNDADVAPGFAAAAAPPFATEGPAEEGPLDELLSHLDELLSELQITSGIAGDGRDEEEEEEEGEEEEAAVKVPVVAILRSPHSAAARMAAVPAALMSAAAPATPPKRNRPNQNAAVPQPQVPSVGVLRTGIPPPQRPAVSTSPISNGDDATSWQDACISALQSRSTAAAAAATTGAALVQELIAAVAALARQAKQADAERNQMTASMVALYEDLEVARGGLSAASDQMARMLLISRSAHVRGCAGRARGMMEREQSILASASVPRSKPSQDPCTHGITDPTYYLTTHPPGLHPSAQRGRRQGACVPPSPGAPHQGAGSKAGGAGEAA